MFYIVLWIYLLLILHYCSWQMVWFTAALIIVIPYSRQLLRKIKTHLKRVLNTLCEVVTGVSRFKSTTPFLKSLHRLPIEFRIKLKSCLLIYKALNTGYIKYLNFCLQPYTSSRSTRMLYPDLKLLATPFYNNHIRTSMSQLENSFMYYAPHLWNTLTLDIISAPSIDRFKKIMKSYLFQQALPT